MAFNLDDYEPVASRVQRFYAAHPDGAIHCEIVHDDGTRVLIKATVWRSISDAQPAAIDYAEEILTDRGVNSTSRIENCATSAVGRAISIAAAGLGSSDWTKKPSREEMQKVERMGGQAASYGNRPSGIATEKQRSYIADLARKLKPPMVLDMAADLSASDAAKLIEQLKAGKLPPEYMPGDEEPF